MHVSPRPRPWLWNFVKIPALECGNPQATARSVHKTCEFKRKAMALEPCKTPVLEHSGTQTMARSVHNACKSKANAVAWSYTELPALMSRWPHTRSCEAHDACETDITDVTVIGPPWRAGSCSHWGRCSSTNPFRLTACGKYDSYCLPGWCPTDRENYGMLSDSTSAEWSLT